MEYQVLARKWRPKNFHQMVGQAHVLRALINALDQDRVHHAYLFTGTRGVGKTTIARIFAKCLNCENGVTSEPCGTCASCVEVDEGRFIDLIEVDAASRTRVEDTRELLENVQYAPTRGRYKVYLIDEVHMLSSHSFNALLKTLEEPPPHVKFLLATTDPQKLPVTILSRCLQFSLKALSAPRISEYLKFLLNEENITFEESALGELGRAANGSMRDALSLTDQAIAFGGGAGVLSSDVQVLLGSIDRGLVFTLLHKLIQEDGQGLLQTANQMLDQGAESSEVLAEVIEVLHATAVAQIVPEAVDSNLVDRDKVIALAEQVGCDDLQLYYQIALMGRKDLPLVPNARSGLEMVLLRMLSFKPQGVGSSSSSSSQSAGKSVASPLPDTSKPATNLRNLSAGQQAPQPLDQGGAQTQVKSVPAQSTTTSGGSRGAPGNASGASQLNSLKERLNSNSPRSQAQIQSAAISVTSQEPSAPEPNMEYAASSTVLAFPSKCTAPQQAARANEMAPVAGDQDAPNASRASPLRSEEQVVQKASPSSVTEDSTTIPERATQLDPEKLEVLAWADIIEMLDIDGAVLNFARNIALEIKGTRAWAFKLKPNHEALYRDHHVKAIETAINSFSEQPISVQLDVGSTGIPTPAEQRLTERKAKLEAAEQNLYADPVVTQLISEFDAQIDKASIEPIE